MKRLSTILLIVSITSTSFAQTIRVQGTVMDKKYDEPLIDVAVSVNTSSIETRTDIDGKYQIDANIGDTLVFKYYTNVYKVKKEIVTDKNCSVELEERIVEKDPIPLGSPVHSHLFSRIHVKGYITDQRTKEPIDNVKVSRKRYVGEYHLIRKEDGQWEKIDSGNIDVFSDGDGYYFTRCYPDDYLEFSHPEYKIRHIQIEDTACNVVLERK